MSSSSFFSPVTVKITHFHIIDSWVSNLSPWFPVHRSFVNGYQRSWCRPSCVVQTPIPGWWVWWTKTWSLILGCKNASNKKHPCTLMFKAWLVLLYHIYPHLLRAMFPYYSVWWTLNEECKVPVNWISGLCFDFRRQSVCSSSGKRCSRGRRRHRNTPHL